jgi:D-glycero-D-manno-heptose 1,7-bisphosphate phosphatase
VFLDRDGVLVEDTGPLCSADRARVLPGCVEALARLKRAGAMLVVVSNQTAVARGLLSEREAESVQRGIERRLLDLGAPALDAFYFCPHHPSATVARYRAPCACRKPGTGLLERARDELGVALADCFLVGDRSSDVRAGLSAGCTTVLVETGRHADPPIETHLLPAPAEPHHRCPDLRAAARWILEEARA